MNRFYQRIDIRRTEKNYISYKGIVFAGVSFRDQKGLPVQITKNRYVPGDQFIPSTSLACGTETNTSSGWIPVGGSIKGSYAIKNGEDIW